MQYFTLNDGNRIPKMGFGTYKLQGNVGVAAITNALLNGYRLLDSAVNYENEGALGRAIKNSSVPRDHIFVTSKLPGRHHAYKEATTQIMFLDIAQDKYPASVDLASSLNSIFANIGISLGSFTGSVIAGITSINNSGYFAAIYGLIAFLAIWEANHLYQKSK